MVHMVDIASQLFAFDVAAVGRSLSVDGLAVGFAACEIALDKLRLFVRIV